MTIWSWLKHPLLYWQSGGPLLIPLAGVCFGIWFAFFRTRRRLLTETAGAAAVAQRLKQQDIAALRGLHGAVATFTRTWLARETPRPDDAERFDNESNRLLRTLKRDIIVLMALTTVAPLLGLLGTVMGMIQTFDAVAVTSGETAARVASGISRALITTQMGLAIAIPGVFGLARLRRLSNHLEVQLGTVKLYAMLTGSTTS